MSDRIQYVVEIPEILGRTRDAYVAAGYDPASFAAALGLSLHTVRNWYQGRMGLDLRRIIQVATVLHVSTDYLCALRDDPQPIARAPTALDVAVRLVAATEVRGISQADVADRIRVGRKQMRSYYLGTHKPSIGRLVILAKVLRCQLDYLCCLSAEMKP